MTALWDAVWMLGAAFSFLFLLRSTPRGRRLVLAGSIALVGSTVTLRALGWSFAGYTADTLAPPVVLFAASLGLAAAIERVRHPLQVWLSGLLGAAGLAAWGLLAVWRALSWGPPDLRADLPGRYRYEIDITGMAWTDHSVTTRVYQSSPWLPGLERLAGASTAHDIGLVSDASALTVEQGSPRREILVLHEGAVLHRVAY